MSSYICVCVCYYSHTLLHLSLSLCISLYIPGTRHRLHNASPPLCCRGAKQRHPASRNTATETHEEKGRVFVYVHVFDRKVDREKGGMCLFRLHINDHVNALALRRQVSGRLCFPGNDAGKVFLHNREDPEASLRVTTA